MSLLPEDLKALPTRPYDKRPSDLPLDVEECRTAIWLKRGNIMEAAALLKITSARLRTFVEKSPYLTREVHESREQLVDSAEDIIRDALSDHKDPQRQDAASRFVLSSLGRSRGWGSGASKMTINNNGGKITFGWADGEGFAQPGDDAKVVNDVKVIEGAEVS